MMFDKSQRQFSQIVSQIIECNPFLPERIALERRALGNDFAEQNANWNLHPHEHQQTENLAGIHARAKALLESLDCAKLATAKEPDLKLIVDLVSLVLFNDFRDAFERLDDQHGKQVAQVYRQFQQAWETYLPTGVVPEEITRQTPHLFAVLFRSGALSTTSSGI